MLASRKNLNTGRLIMKIRTLIERLSRGRILKRTIRVNDQTGPLYVSPDAQLKYMKIGSSAFDADLIRIAERLLHEKSIVWDVGANIGVFTFAAAMVASKGTVISIEADAWLATVLRKTRALNFYQDCDIKILPLAVSNKNGTAAFNIAARGRASNSLADVDARSTQGGVRETHYVPTLTLDTLASEMPSPDFIKIDVEGAEDLAVGGAKRLILETRPVFYMEIGPGNDSIFEFFKNAGYATYGPRGRVLQRDKLENIFFVPSERGDWISKIGKLDCS